MGRCVSFRKQANTNAACAKAVPKSRGPSAQGYQKYTRIHDIHYAFRFGSRASDSAAFSVTSWQTWVHSARLMSSLPHWLTRQLAALCAFIVMLLYAPSRLLRKINTTRCQTEACRPPEEVHQYMPESCRPMRESRGLLLGTHTFYDSVAKPQAVRHVITSNNMHRCFQIACQIQARWTPVRVFSSTRLVDKRCKLLVSVHRLFPEVPMVLVFKSGLSEVSFAYSDLECNTIYILCCACLSAWKINRRKIFTTLCFQFHDTFGNLTPAETNLLMVSASHHR